MAKVLVHILKNYKTAVIVPVITGSLIYLDYSRTQKFKARNNIVSFKQQPGCYIIGGITYLTLVYGKELLFQDDTYFRDKSALYGRPPEARTELPWESRAKKLKHLFDSEN